MQLTVHVGPEFQKTMAYYAAWSKKSMGEVIARQTRELGFYLYGAFKNIAPARHQIASEAVARSHRYARPLSPKAYEFAHRIMGGQDSVYGRVFEWGKGTYVLRTVRVGKKGKRIRGGRKARGGIAASYAQGKQMAMKGEYALNYQAVASFYELMLRLRGVKSLAVSWLPAMKKRVSPQEAARGILIKHQIMQPRATIKWTAGMMIDTTAPNMNAQLSSDVPGLSRYPDIIDEGIENAERNMMTYIDRKMWEALAGNRSY